MLHYIIYTLSKFCNSSHNTHLVVDKVQIKLENIKNSSLNTHYLLILQTGALLYLIGRKKGMELQNFYNVQILGVFVV